MPASTTCPSACRTGCSTGRRDAARTTTRASATWAFEGACMTAPLHHLTHPLIQHKLTLMRQKERSTNSFRRLLNEIGSLMAYEVTRDMPTQLIEIETPLERMQSPVIDGKKTVFVSIMRAGAGFLDG